MPQLDVLTFTSQLFWLILTFFALYLTLARFILAPINKTLKSRESLISNIQQPETVDESAEISILSNTHRFFKNNLEAFVAETPQLKVESLSVISDISTKKEFVKQCTETTSI